ncbi:hypothetical protein SUGI_1132380 [Cryptomeria japonica]|nr:hypothetical protein SUGI_1132380 [Cryptomeria japonica]
MTRAQWLSTCWRNAWTRNNQSFYMQFVFPCLVLAFVAVWMVWAAWLFLEGYQNSQLKKLKYGSIPVTAITIFWYAFKGAISVFKPVSKQLSGYFSLPDHSDQLGYQQKVISDIKFLMDEIGKEPYIFFSWWGLWEDTVEGTPVPKYGSAPQDKLRIIAFVDDLDHCEDEVILRVLWAINLVFRVCDINVILAMDKNTIETALKNSSQNQDDDYVDKASTKRIPSANDLKQELGHEPSLNKVHEDLPRENTETISPANEDQVITVNERNDGENVNRSYEGCIPSSYNLLTQRQERLSYWFTKILNWVRGFPYRNKRGGESEQEEDDLTFQPLLKRARLVRETLMQSYSEQEVQPFNKLRGFGTGIQKLPQEWKCYINYHKFARNVVAKKTKHASQHPSAWRVEFVAWTFVCSQWKHEVNCLIQDWHSFTDVIDKNGKTKREPSLKEIVANYIKQRWRPEQSDSIKEKEKKEQDVDPVLTLMPKSVHRG